MSGVVSHSDLPDGSVVLTLIIDNSEPVEVGAFVRAFTSLAKEYQETFEKKGLDGRAEIFITQVRSGSIVADLVPLVATAFPVVVSHAAQVDQAIDFVAKWGSRITTLASGLVPEGMSKSDLRTFAGAVEAIARDPNASSIIEVATFEDGKREIKAAFRFSTAQARVVEKTIEGEFKRLEQDSDKTHHRKLMYFTRSDITNAPIDRRSGEKAVIPEISQNSLPIIYASDLAEERIKYEIRESQENIFKKGFSVDVSVQYRGDRPLAYRIIEVHQIFDLPDDDDEP
ncbi:hypothetical protein [Paracoccus shandongensis]|uniref:hypothetical protein n=1 Tax=Paracoccus shandongensis TaxID=2816048 RepID=UPI001A8E9F7F|nr:hypothetical protein [Paracoccus shandongensis]